MSPGDHESVLRSLQESAFTSQLHARIRLAISKIEERGRKRAHINLLNYQGRIDRKALLGLLTSWVFNYNTVSNILPLNKSIIYVVSGS